MNEQEIREGLDIAIVGMSCRFPGAGNIDEYWDNLKNGRETISFFTKEELEKEGIEKSQLDDPRYVKVKGTISDADCFDAEFFDYTHGEALLKDPQVRVFHEVVWHALEDAGCSPDKYNGLIGLYAGASNNVYWELLTFMKEAQDGRDGFSIALQTDKDLMSSHISYKLNLKGPSFTVASACSTSMAAVHLACQGLINGDCDIALAGGVSITLPYKSGHLYQPGMIFSKDGHCRAFDEDASGVVFGNGAGAVALKRIEDAVRDGDKIYAVIKSTALNNDGNRKAGYTAPSSDGQAEVIKKALQLAEVDSETVSYVETHGTGTNIGDPIEIEGLKKAFKTSKKQFCGIGSVKTNIGHLDSAAGISGLIKLALSLHHKAIPPSLNFKKANPELRLEDSPFYVNTKLKQWERDTSPRRAGLSSFGVGGTNVHAVLEEAPRIISRESSPPKYSVFSLSAKTRPALNRMISSTKDFLKDNIETLSISDVCYTLHIGRKDLRYRISFTCETLEEAVNILDKEPEIYEVESVENNYNTADRPTHEKELAEHLSNLYLQGGKIDWSTYYKGRNLKKVNLPKYPFERTKFTVPSAHLNLGENINLISQPKKHEDIGEWFYTPFWEKYKKAPNSVINITEPKNWLLICDPSGFAPAMQEFLSSQKQNVTLVSDSDSGIYTKVIQNLKENNCLPDEVVHFGGLVDEHMGNADTLSCCYQSLIGIAKALRKNKISKDIKITAVTSDAFNILGNEETTPEKELVQAPCKVVPQEMSNISFNTIDVEASSLKKADIASLLIGLIINKQEPDKVIAIRNNYIWKQKYLKTPISAPDTGELPLTNNGVYLITGGLGQVGGYIASYLSKAYKAKIVLTTRKEFPAKDEWEKWIDKHGSNDLTAQRIRKIQEIEKHGGEVFVVSADIGSYDEMSRAIEHIYRKLGRLNGVIHAAGMIRTKSGQCPVEEVSMSEINEQFYPKVQGTKVLCDVLREKQLDFFIATSSLATILGGLGHIAYAAANQYMEGLIKKYNHQFNKEWKIINWDEWKGRDASNSKNQLGGNEAMLPDEGVETLLRVLSRQNTEQVVASTSDLDIKMRQWVLKEHVDDSQEKVDEYEGFSERPKCSSEYIAPVDEVEKAIADIWRKLFRIKDIGTTDDFFELGGDSLKAVTSLSKIHKELGVEISIMDFFENSTIQGLKEYIENETGVNQLKPIPLTPPQEYYPLSSAQKRFYFVSKLDPRSTAYNDPIFFWLEGDVDLEKLKDGFVKIIKRHEAFRTSFTMVNGVPAQKIWDTVKFELEYSEPNQDEVQSIISSFARPFDLSAAPLLRAGVTKANGKYIMMIDTHHIVTDGVSQEIFLKEFIDLYNGKSLPEIKIQYKDYSEWKSLPEVRNSLSKCKDYWKKTLSGELPVLNLYTDFKRQPSQDFSGDNISFEISPEIIKQAKKIIEQEGATLYIFLAAVLSVMLHKMTEDQDIIIGSPVSGRVHPDTMNIIGAFINMLPIRNYPKPDKLFNDFLKEVKSSALSAFENQEYQFEDIILDLGLQGNVNRHPLFDVMLVLQNMKEKQGEIDRVKMTLYDYDNKRAHCDLMFVAKELEGTINIKLEYATSLYRKDTIEKIAHAYVDVMRQVVEDTEIKLCDVKIVEDIFSSGSAGDMFLKFEI